MNLKLIIFLPFPRPQDSGLY
jgi:lipoyl synthase